MKPARKTRDFSIESILADKRVQNEKRYGFGVQNCGDVRTEECRATNSGKHFKECTTNASSEIENCEITAEEKYKTNSQLPNEHNLDVKNFECENENKLQTHSDMHKINIRKCTADSESDFTNKIEETNGKCDRNILEQETFGSNDTKAEIIRYVEDKCTINSKKFESEGVTSEEKHKNNYCKMIKKDQVKLNEKRKKQSKQDQSDQLYDSSVKYLNKNCSDFPENRCKSSRDNLNSFETTESKYSSFKNENKKSEFSRSKTGTPEVLRDIEKLEWLQCTRYKPPKIPRKPTIGKNKRKPSFYPRIPFSMFQLDFLEQKFQNSAYLTRNDVMDISDVLKLPPNRIKIWFQNRRARERREFCTNV